MKLFKLLHVFTGVPKYPELKGLSFQKRLKIAHERHMKEVEAKKPKIKPKTNLSGMYQDEEVTIIA
jgi:hypothetical protein